MLPVAAVLSGWAEPAVVVNCKALSDMNLGVLHCNQNLSYYMVGQEGYFSPQRQMSMAFPVSWTALDDRQSWGINGSLDVQSFTQNASPYFPTTPAR